jgi:site-specific recombinase XerD
VFTRQDGSAWRKNLHQRDLVRANAAANISPPLTFHHLRHAYASHLLRNGARIEYVSELLGHSSIAVTRKHYAHLTREDLKKAAALLPSFGFTPANKVVALEPKPAKRRAAGE